MIIAARVAIPVCTFAPYPCCPTVPPRHHFPTRNYDGITRETERGAMTIPLMVACLRGCSCCSCGGCRLKMGTGLAIRLAGARGGRDWATGCGGWGWATTCGGRGCAMACGEKYVAVANDSDVGCWTASRTALSSCCLAFPFFRFSSSFIAL